MNWVHLLEEALAISEHIDQQIKLAKAGIQFQVDEEPRLKLHADILVERAHRESWALTRKRQHLLAEAKDCFERLGNVSDAAARLTLLFAEIARAFCEDLTFMLILDRPKMEPPEAGLLDTDLQKDLVARVIAHRKLDRLWCDRVNDETEKAAEQHRALLAGALATARTLVN